MFGLGMAELIAIGVIALIFIGPKKLPELAKGIGQGIKEFQKAAQGLSDQLQNSDAAKKDETAEVQKVTDAPKQVIEEQPQTESFKKEDHHS